MLLTFMCVFHSLLALNILPQSYMLLTCMFRQLIIRLENLATQVTHYCFKTILQHKLHATNVHVCVFHSLLALNHFPQEFHVCLTCICFFNTLFGLPPGVWRAVQADHVLAACQ